MTFLPRSPGFLRTLAEHNARKDEQMRAIGAVAVCTPCGAELILGTRLQCSPDDLVWAESRWFHRRCWVPQSWMAL